MFTYCYFLEMTCRCFLYFILFVVYNYLCTRLTLKEGKKHGSYVSCTCLLDRNVYCNVFCRRNVYYFNLIPSTNGFFPYIKLSETLRAHVYVFVWSVLNCVYDWIYLVYRIHFSTRVRSLNSKNSCFSLLKQEFLLYLSFLCYSNVPIGKKFLH